MSALLARIRALLAMEPAAVSWALNGGIALLFAYAFHLGKTEEAAVATIVTALAAIYTAVRVRRADAPVPVIVGALVTIVTAASAFGLHASPQAISLGSAVASALLAMLFRANVTPKAALKARAAERARL